jgi:hypothetical protein
MKLQRCHTKDIKGLAINRNNNIATASADNKIVFWCPNTGAVSKQVLLTLFPAAFNAIRTIKFADHR